MNPCATPQGWCTRRTRSPRAGAGASVCAAQTNVRTLILLPNTSSDIVYKCCESPLGLLPGQTLVTSFRKHSRISFIVAPQLQLSQSVVNLAPENSIALHEERFIFFPGPQWTPAAGVQQRCCATGFVARAKSGVDWPTFQRIFMQVCPPVRCAQCAPPRFRTPINQRSKIQD